MRILVSMQLFKRVLKTEIRVNSSFSLSTYCVLSSILSALFVLLI